MKKSGLVCIIFLAAFYNVNAQKACCPKFYLSATQEPCDTLPRESPTGGSGTNGHTKCTLKACNNSTQKYFIYPNKIGFTYTWQVTGGTPVTTTGNPMNIVWSSGTSAKIKVFISNADGSCRDTVVTDVCLVKGPKANFNFTPSSPICNNTNIQFSNNSVGSVAYYWNFGDGNTSVLENPNHTYTTPGIYNVVLSVISSLGNGGAIGQDNPTCGCKDTIMKTIVVKNEAGISIISGCKQMLCAGDTASYCAGTTCSNYNWSVTGGTIIGSNKEACINIVWDGTYPSTVTLNGSCGGSCGNTATINVPVLYPTIPIVGKNIVCPGSTTGYGLPAMPGTFYTWTIASGGSIIGPNQNTSTINVQWGNVFGDYIITCNYQNPTTKCSGKDTIVVKVAPKYQITGLEKFCVGSNFNFSASGAGTWDITPSLGYTPPSFPAGISIFGTWNVKGNYIVKADATIPTNFCEASAILNVVVVDTPKLNPIIGNNLICAGSTQVYAVSSNIDEPFFNWSSPTNGNIISTMGSNSDSVVVQWNAAGPYSISVSQTVDGCTSSPKTFSPTVYAKPIITGIAITCMDNVINYTTTSAAPAGGYAWSLSNANGSITTGQGTNNINIMWHGNLANAVSSCQIFLTTCGGKDTFNVTIQPPTAVTISTPNNLCAVGGQTLTASIAGGTYQWFLNGVAMAAGFNTQSINVLNAGNYSVVVTNASGCKSKGYITIVQPYFPPASISTPDKVWWKCTETISTTFNALPTGVGYCYQWYYSPVANSPGSMVGTNSPSFTQTIPGYTWCVVSLCNTGCKSNADTVKTVKESCDTLANCNPNYTFNVTHNSCNPFVFNATVTPPIASTTAHWYFGDGKWDSEGYGLNITHKYDHIGTYKVCAIFGTNPYCRKDTCFNINVPVVANFKAIANCKNVTLTNLSETIAPGSTTYNWSFPGANITSSSLQNPPSISYAANGLHYITLTVSNGICTEVFTDTVRTNIPAATSTVPSPICALTNAPFIATTSGIGFTYHWNFGDGFTSNLQNTNHAYATSGTYNVILTVTDEKGCIAKDTTAINVLPAITVAIGADKSFCIGGSAIFTATPSSFSTYQWYKDGVAISGATAASIAVNTMGEYWVEVSNGSGCKAISNKAKAIYLSSPIAKIKKMKVVCKSGTSTNFNISNYLVQAGNIYKWICVGATFTANNSNPAWNTYATVSAVGDFQFILEVTNLSGCTARDTMCVTVVNNPVVTITNPVGPLCEGQLHTFVANATPTLTLPDEYFYQWSNGVVGTTATIGFAGMATVTVTNPSGCKATGYTSPIKKRADVSLFPVGCDTLCLTDTVHFPLPLGGGLSASSYTIQWYDSGSPIGTNSTYLPLALIGPGDHHFYCIVSLSGSCPDTTGTFDLFVKDCTLLPPCDNCPAMLDNATFEMGSVKGNIMNGSFTFTSTKPLKEVRINVADLKYHWNDPNCINCKATIEDRACIYPANTSQTVGTLVWDNFTGAGIPPLTSGTDCPKQLIFKTGAVLPPGTYSIPLQVSFAAAPKSNCKLVINKFCMHLAITDEECKVCEKNVCTKVTNTSDDCACAAANNWTNLFITPVGTGIPKPKTFIFCNSSITGYAFNTPYLLSGIYNCKPGCAAIKNEVVIRNQTGDIIYTHVGATLYENIIFPVKGIYTVTLTAYCGDKKCECKFQITVDKVTVTAEPPEVVNIPNGNPVNNPPTTNTPTQQEIENVLTGILPPDFSGQILVAKKDSVLYEKYKGNNVNNHTSFDLASVAKTFTAMAVLKMAEENKIKLSDDVTKYLSNFPILGISIKMLLSHNSGLDDYVKFLQSADVDKSEMLSNGDLLQYIIKNKSKIQTGKPGGSFNYSNTNFAMLALIIEKVSGQTYGQYLADKFFKPLKMEDTYVFSQATSKTATPSYYKNGKAYDLKFLDFIYGDKNVYSSVKDMMKWDKALRDGKIFSQETMRQAYTANSTLIADQSNYGLGWRLLLVPNGKKIVYHNGWWHGNRSVFIRLLDEEAVIIILSNSSFTTISNSRKLADLFGAYKQTGRSIVNF